MGKLIKYALVGLAGYFVGFYELKYKLMKSELRELREQVENYENQNNEEA